MRHPPRALVTHPLTCGLQFSSHLNLRGLSPSLRPAQDRTDRELVTPWFRFLWESYRSVLEILRTNPKLEPLYAMTATKAFHFCLQYKRTTEFKRLCDILRQHLTNLVK